MWGRSCSVSQDLAWRGGSEAVATGETNAPARVGCGKQKPFSFVLQAVVGLFYMFTETGMEPDGRRAGLEQGGLCTAAPAIVERFHRLVGPG